MTRTDDARTNTRAAGTSTFFDSTMPTVELTAHLGASPTAAGDWVRIDQRCRWLDAETAVEDALHPSRAG